MTARPNRCSVAWALYLGLMALKLILALTMPAMDSLSGDEHGYVEKARHLHRHGTFPAIAQSSEAERTLQYSDFRPPGYPLFVFAFRPFAETNARLRLRVCLGQFLLDLATTTLLLGVALRLNPAKGFQIASAAVLGIQPWTSAYITSIYPDTLAMSLTVMGIAGLAGFAGRASPVGRGLALLSGSALLSLSFLVRPEMIVLVPILVLMALGMALRRDTWRIVALYAGLSALPFFAAVGLNVAYRWQVEHQFRIFGEFRHATPGLDLWVQTWIGSQTLKEELQFGGLTSARMSPERFSAFPERVFANEAERATLVDIVKNVQARGYLTVAEDDVFRDIAHARIAADPLTFWLWTRLYNTFHFWINLSNATHYLHGFARVPGPVSKMLTGGFFILKIIVLIGFGIGLFRMGSRGVVLTQSWPSRFILLGAACALLRTLLFGFCKSHAEFRYAVVVWPFVLMVALYGLAQWWPGLPGGTGDQAQPRPTFQGGGAAWRRAGIAPRTGRSNQ